MSPYSAQVVILIGRQYRARNAKRKIHPVHTGASPMRRTLLVIERSPRLAGGNRAVFPPGDADFRHFFQIQDVIDLVGGKESVAPNQLTDEDPLLD